MTRWVARVLKALFALAVAAGLTYGAVSAIQLRAGEECGDDPGELDTCPPFTEMSCNETCFMMNGSPGGCVHFSGGECCTCTV